MNPQAAAIGAMSVVMPLAVEVPVDYLPAPSSEAVTSLKVAGGKGVYAFVVRGCSGQVIRETPVEYRDAGIELDHRFAESAMGVGVRAGMVRDEIGSGTTLRFGGAVPSETITNAYVNPYITIEDVSDVFALGVGIVFHEKPFITADETARTQEDHPLNNVSGHLRVGRARGPHLIVQWMESVPLYSGGGYLTAMLGGASADSRLEMSLGLSMGGPYEGLGLGGRVSVATINQLRLNLHGRVGEGGSRSSTGLGIGLEYRILHGP